MPTKAERERSYRHKKAQTRVYTCKQCGAAWCPLPASRGRQPATCSELCHFEWRRLAANERYDRSKQYRCSSCGELGHNKLTCYQSVMN